MARLDRRTMKKLLPALFLLCAFPGFAQTDQQPLMAGITTKADNPFELISFEAQPTDAGVELNWSTAHESAGGAYIVERSTDRMNWTATATQVGRGGSGEHVRYTAIDPGPVSGVAYYRLQYMINGSDETISDDFAVERKAQEGLLIQGDRTSRQFTVLGKGSISELKVLNNRGQFLPMVLDYQGDRVVVNGDLLEPGTYFVQAMVDGMPVLRQLTVTATSVLGG